jgi:hypothetical protein
MDPELFDYLYGGRTEEERNVFIPEKIRKQRVRNQYTVEDRYSSVFYKNYILPSLQENPPIRDLSTTIGKTFRRRFRVPFCVFLEICESIKATHNLPEDKYDAKGQEGIKLSLLVLGSLRMLGSGCTFDAIEELTCVSRVTHRKFFHKYFCTWGQDAAKDIIRLPHDEDSILHVMALYERKGLPGCVGSVDCVHVCWDKCPSSLHSTCKGKDKVPTLAFEVACSHTKKIIHVSQFFWGTYNDKTISRFDPLFRFLRDDDSILKNLRWTSVGRDGTRKEHRGAYMICDGGYNEWACLMPPYKHQLPGTALEKWSKNVESVRKDVECVFGILKTRFLFLKHPIRLHDPVQIQRAFTTCCVLHNILLEYDMYDDWNEDASRIDVEYGILEESAALRAGCSRNGRGVAGTRSSHRELYLRDDAHQPEDDGTGIEEYESPQFHHRRQCLIDHYHGWYSSFVRRGIGE